MWAEPEAQSNKSVEKHGLVQITDTGAIEAMVDEVLANNAKAVEQFKAGNEKSPQCDCRAGDESQQRQSQPRAGAGIGESQAGVMP